MRRIRVKSNILRLIQKFAVMSRRLTPMSWQQDPDVHYERSYKFRISFKHLLFGLTKI